jgi:hypothetical protein
MVVPMVFQMASLMVDLMAVLTVADLADQWVVCSAVQSVVLWAACLVETSVVYWVDLWAFQTVAPKADSSAAYLVVQMAAKLVVWWADLWEL